ncbi:MAG: biotin--[acetyl-CoA-carboxylase] ligase [Bacteroidales bacterium]|nr:biotin--[acetyl-CoA-carboxylase] ligase [Bacteroidales bacterium]
MERKYHILWHDTIDSTNSEAIRRLTEIDNMSVIAARCQTSGRGQRGNRWSSMPSENLTFSIVIRPGQDGIPKISARDQFRISEITTIALTGYLKANGLEARIKWPNDIYCGDRKICGILIEHSIRDGYVTSSVIGIGLNLNQTSFPPELPNPVSMKSLTGKSYSPGKELERFMEYFSRLACRADCPQLEEEYLQQMYRKDEKHMYTDIVGGTEFPGIIRGIAGDACLAMEMPDGNIRKFAFKEIGYII